MPAVDANDLDGVDARMLLESFQGIDEDGLVVDIQELFRDVLSHPGAGTSGDDDGNCHIIMNLNTWKAVSFHFFSSS